MTHIVLDLDETLVSVSTTMPKRFDFSFLLDGGIYYAQKRPGLDLFLQYIFKHFQSVSVWTAAVRGYAIFVVNNIMTSEQRNKLLFLKTRDDLAISESGYYKPLRQIFMDPLAKAHGLTKANTIMVDDRRDVLRDNPGNGIVIPAWKGGCDSYLLKLLVILDGILCTNIGFGYFSHVIDLRDLVD